MSSLHDTQVVSIYDLMMDRRRKLGSESQIKNISPEPRKKVQEDASANYKEWKKNLVLLQKKELRARARSRSLESVSTCPSNAITASHLTKKQTIIKIQPANKEVIKKLVEKISNVCNGPKAMAVEPQMSPSPRLKPGSGTQRKESASLGTSRDKQKRRKSNPSLGNRRQLSQRMTGRGPIENKSDRTPKEKKTLLTTPKLKSPKTSRLQVRRTKQSEGPGNTASPSNDRWRI